MEKKTALKLMSILKFSMLTIDEQNVSSRPGLQGCDAMWWCVSILKFRRTMLSPSLGWY